MVTETELRNFLEKEYQANRTHSDHINDHRLSFLKFYAGFMASILGGAKYLQTIHATSFEADNLVLGLLAIGCLFGVLTVVVMANYWIGRDYMRVRNNVAVEEFLADRPNIERYLKISKKHVKRLPSGKSMFAFVTAMVVLGNQVVMLTFIQQIDLPGGVRTFVVFSYPLVQVVLVVLYRWMTLGRSVEQPSCQPIERNNGMD